jgi:hypothetical protein
MQPIELESSNALCHAHRVCHSETILTSNILCDTHCKTRLGLAWYGKAQHGMVGKGRERRRFDVCASETKRENSHHINHLEPLKPLSAFVLATAQESCWERCLAKLSAETDGQLPTTLVADLHSAITLALG